MGKKKNRRNGNLFLFIICCATFLLGAFYVLDFFGNFMVETMIFAGGMLVIGIAYLAYYSLVPSAATGEWPIIEGLLDVLLAIVLFMSMGTSKTDMIVYILSVWALAGFISRLICALKMTGKSKKRELFNAGALLLSALVMAGLTAFTLLIPQIVAGGGVMIYSIGSFVNPSKAFAAKVKK